MLFAFTLLGHSFRVLSAVTVCPQVLRTLRLLRGDALDKSLTLGQYVSELTCLSLNRDFQRPSHVFSERAEECGWWMVDSGWFLVDCGLWIVDGGWFIVDGGWWMEIRPIA